MYVEVILKSTTKLLDRLFTYHIKEIIDCGVRVIVPFGRGNKRMLGLVIRVVDKPITKYQIKDVAEIIDKKPLLDKELIELAFFMKKKYLSDYSSAFQTVLPPGNWQDIKEYFYDMGENGEVGQRETFESMQKERGLSYSEVNQLVTSGKMIREFSYDAKVKQKKEIFLQLQPSNYYNSISKRAFAQRKVIDYLKDHPNVMRKEVIEACNVTSSVIKELEKKGVVNSKSKTIYRSVIKENIQTYHKIKLNEDQEKAYQTILNSKKTLIHGVTGSGKTEVYLQLVEQTLNNGRDAIILVPEISLTPQTIERFEGRFPNQVAILHSKLSISERFEQWKRIDSGEYKIVVGARSAIFAPVKNLGLVVIDEEHELSYVSEADPKYHVIDVANFRCDFNEAKFVLGSATPSVEDYWKAKQGIYQLVEMNKRANNRDIPTTTIVDMTMELKNGNTSMFSELLEEKIHDALRRNEQVILFLNKRGHTSFVFCRRCGYVMRCNTCDVAMTYHKSKNRLICHMCGRTERKLERCPHCGSKAIKEFGAGTEKLEEETKKLYPNAVVYRMDRDTVTKKESYNELYKKMKNQEIDILIGTQMVSKGLDFENVSLVGVMAADLSINQGDFRASSRTFELITQVSGRAGRGKTDGEVIIQTYKPKHFAIQSASKANYDFFYQQEIEARMLYQYPPFYKLLKINLTHLSKAMARNKAMEIMHLLRLNFKSRSIQEIRLLGPNPSPIERINNRYRMDIMIKYSASDKRIEEVVRNVLVDQRINLDLTGYTMKIMINPVSFY